MMAENKILNKTSNTQAAFFPYVAVRRNTGRLDVLKAAGYLWFSAATPVPCKFLVHSVRFRTEQGTALNC
jgi:hypothetical protein